MEAQPTLVDLDPYPVDTSEPPPEANPTSKLVFGQKPHKGKPVMSADAVGNAKLKPIDRSQLLMKTVDLEHLLEPNHSAREIERLMVYEPGLMWMCGADAVNHHTLSDFRVEHKAALDGLFQELLAVLEGEGLIDLSQVMHDGTKVRANAGVDTFRRKKTIEARLELAKQ